VTRSGDWRLLRPPPLFPPQYMSQDQACIDLGGMVCASSSSARTTIGACIIRVPLRSQDACSLSIFDDLISITPTTPCSCEGLRRQDGTGAVTLVQPNTLPCSIHPSIHTYYIQLLQYISYLGIKHVSSRSPACISQPQTHLHTRSCNTSNLSHADRYWMYVVRTSACQAMCVHSLHSAGSDQPRHSSSFLTEAFTFTFTLAVRSPVPSP